MKMRLVRSIFRPQKPSAYLSAVQHLYSLYSSNHNSPPLIPIPIPSSIIFLSPSKPYLHYSNLIHMAVLLFNLFETLDSFVKYSSNYAHKYLL